jgi:hypothetical protein
MNELIGDEAVYLRVAQFNLLGGYIIVTPKGSRKSTGFIRLIFKQ